VLFVLLSLRANSPFVNSSVIVFCPFMVKVLICVFGLSEVTQSLSPYMVLVGGSGGARPSGILSFSCPFVITVLCP